MFLKDAKSAIFFDIVTKTEAVQICYGLELIKVSTSRVYVK